MSSITMKRRRDMPYEPSFSFVSDSAISMGAELPFIYEQMIQKLESDVRNHIKVENQLKLILGKHEEISHLQREFNYNLIPIESTQFKIEEYEKSVKEERENLQSQLKQKEDELKVFRYSILEFNKL